MSPVSRSGSGRCCRRSAANTCPGEGYASLGMIYEPGKVLPVGHVDAAQPRPRSRVPQLRGLPRRHGARYAGLGAARLHRHARAHAESDGIRELLLPVCGRCQVQCRLHRSGDRSAGRQAGHARSLPRLSGRHRADARTPADAARTLRLVAQATGMGSGSGRYLQSVEGAVQLSVGQARAAREHRHGGFSVDLGAAQAQTARRWPADAIALGRQQHQVRGTQQECRLRHRHHAAYHRSCWQSADSRNGCSTSCRRSTRIRSIARWPRRVRRSMPSTAPPATAPAGRTSRASEVGHVVPIERIGTDRHRLDSFTPELAQNLGSVYAGLPVAIPGLPQDLRLRQHAARRHLAARPLSAQRVGAEHARSAGTERQATEDILPRLRRL